MLMAVNIGNARISVGVFEDASASLVTKFQIATDLHKTSDEYSVLLRSMIREREIPMDACTDAIISSVVPQLTETIKESVGTMAEHSPLIVGPGLKTGFPIKIDTPSELGGDIVADVAAVIHSLRSEGRTSAAIVAHLGMVTTVSAINRSGEFVGCAIFPGIRLSFETLHGKTAQLPNVGFSDIERAIGKNSQESVRSGVILGHAMTLDGFVRRFAKEMKCRTEEVTFVVTGEETKYVERVCGTPFVCDEDLTLKGLYNLYQNTSKIS